MQKKSVTSTNQSNIFTIRQANLRRAIHEKNLDGMALNPGPSLTYLTGLHFHLSERPVVGLFPASGRPVLVLPELESAKTSSLDYSILAISYGEDPAGWPASFANGLEAGGLINKTIGVESLHMRVLELNLLQSSSTDTRFIPADDVTASLRVLKDASEADFMREAVKIAQEAMNTALKSFRAGMTEREFAGELTLNLLRSGSDSEFPFSPIVSGGPNSANPHASPSDRPIQNGDLLVVDWGATYKGYISDLTRTFAIGAVENELAHIAKIVLQANNAGQTVCQPGTPAEAVDQEARAVIEQAGYGRYFIHRTGHGIGMESHEDPYIRSGNRQTLQPGMCFTVEPGIYLPGRGGVRIEDNVMIKNDGYECFSDLPRELRTLPL